jgi:LDH2 family malate/lactate/ureidoglycolate dehydrogenase
MDPVYLFPHAHLERVAHDILRGAGSPEAEAALVAQRLLKSNLSGHDSHGIIRIPRYMGWVRDGTIRPGQRVDFLRDNGSTAVLTGHRGYGQVVATEAMQVAVQRAREHRLVAVGVTDLTHIGRLADYAVLAAAAGMIGMVFTSTGGFSRLVAPFGGAERRMSTNPMAVAFPSDRAEPIVFDFASSAYAEGKFRVFSEGHVPTPPGILIDAAGAPSTDADDLYGGGAILPLGGEQGYKGYLLNFMMEVLGGLLTGGGFVGKEEKPVFNNCSLLIVLDVTAFRELPAFKAELEGLIAYLKASRAAPGGEVLYPGEKEARSEARRRAEGVPLAETTVRNLQAEMQRYGVAGELLPHGTPAPDASWKY